MVVLVIEDPGSGERNSYGFFVLKDADGTLHFGCAEYLMKTTSIQAAMDSKGSIAQDWTDWRHEDDLHPATMAEVEQAKLGSYVTGELDTETSQWTWRRESSLETS